MDAPLYDVLPAYVTTLHSVKNPDLPDQKIRFPSGEVMPVAAGATACKQHSGERRAYATDIFQSTLALARSSCSRRKRRHLR
jgi:hypothetical protein